MTSAKNPADSEESSRPALEPVTPAKRKRLQQIFERGSQMMAQDNFDYATELLAQCVIGDPSNLSYLQSYIANLQKKYNNNKTGSKLAQFKERGSRSGLKKAVAQGKWDEAIPHGLKVLAVNPWDVAALTGLATVAGNAGYDEPEMFYLKCALNVNSKDADVNRQCALALAERQQFDQAIACWHRVEQARPGDEEAQRAIANLAVEKTIVMGKFDDADETKKLGGHHSAPPKAPEREVSFEERLRQQIQRNPRDLPSYHELAQIYLNAENYQAAEEVYASAFKVSDGDAEVRERWEDVQIRHLRKRISQAEDEPTKEKLRKQYHEKNLAYRRNLCQRYPGNPLYRYDLGISLYDNKEYNEAIKELQAAKTDPRRKGECLLALGKCFLKIKQYRLAITHYEAAIAEIPDRETDNKRDALYRAGKLSLALNDMDAAEKHLTYLAGLDFAYKDVSELLDKIAQTRENKGLDS